MGTVPYQRHVLDNLLISYINEMLLFYMCNNIIRSFFLFSILYTIFFLGIDEFWMFVTKHNFTLS